MFDRYIFMLLLSRLRKFELICRTNAEEVQNSNMSKFCTDGNQSYNDKGKVMKGPNYFDLENCSMIKDNY